MVVVICLFWGIKNMSKAKDKRIKKFNKKRIWPSIVGLFFLSILIFTITLGLLTLYIDNVIEGKLYDAYKLSYRIAEHMMSDDFSDISSDEMNTYLEVTDSVKYITVFDSDNNIAWTNNDFDINPEETYFYNDGLMMLYMH